MMGFIAEVAERPVPGLYVSGQYREYGLYSPPGMSSQEERLTHDGRGN